MNQFKLIILVSFHNMIIFIQCCGICCIFQIFQIICVLLYLLLKRFMSLRSCKGMLLKRMFFIFLRIPLSITKGLTSIGLSDKKLGFLRRLDLISLLQITLKLMVFWLCTITHLIFNFVFNSITYWVMGRYTQLSIAK